MVRIRQMVIFDELTFRLVKLSINPLAFDQYSSKVLCKKLGGTLRCTQCPFALRYES